MKTKRQNIERIKKVLNYVKSGSSFFFTSSVHEIRFIDFNDLYFKTLNWEGYSFDDLTAEELNTITEELINAIYEDLKAKLYTIEKNCVDFYNKFVA